MKSLTCHYLYVKALSTFHRYLAIYFLSLNRILIQRAMPILAWILLDCQVQALLLLGRTPHRLIQDSYGAYRLQTSQVSRLFMRLLLRRHCLVLLLSILGYPLKSRVRNLVTLLARCTTLRQHLAPLLVLVPLLVKPQERLRGER